MLRQRGNLAECVRGVPALFVTMKEKKERAEER